jgi:nucleotide-binding universal stress UspA family protein
LAKSSSRTKVDAITGRTCKIDVDLIVVGHRHLYSRAARWWQGSTARELIGHAPFGVITH